MAGSKLSQDFGEAVVERLTSDSPTRSLFNKFKIGIGTTAASQGDTDLENSVPFTGTEQVDDCETADWADSADMTSSLNTTYFKEGDKSLNLTKDGVASVNANVDKTTTSLNFTDKELSIWLKIEDSATLTKLETTDAVTIRFGSDSSNYYQWTKDSTDLAVGWNLINGLTVSSADSTIGTPVLTAMDYSFIQLTATGAAIVWSAGNILMDDWKIISAGDYISDEVTSYPTPTLATLEETHRLYIPSTQANSYNLSEVAIVNTDTTRLMSTRGTFTKFSKSLTDELIVVIKNKLRLNEVSTS